MLATTAFNDAERTVENVAVGVDRHAESKVIVAIGRVAVVPGAVIQVEITASRLRQRFWRLVDREIIKFVKHAVSLFLFWLGRA
jgi:hypothetical protein